MTDNRGQTAGGPSDPAARAEAGPADSSGLRPGAEAEAVVRRTREGWRVGDDDVPDLTCAMVLADLLAAELPTSQEGGGQSPSGQPGQPGQGRAQSEASSGLAGQKPAGQDLGSQKPASQRTASQKPASQDMGSQKPASQSTAGQRTTSRRPVGKVPAGPPDSAENDLAAATETSKLRSTIGQLERALITRIRVEQAIGVLAERHRIQPRQAFEQLRAAARNRGRRVIDIAADVVASASNPLLQLPDELSRPRSAGRHRGRRGHGPLDAGTDPGAA